MLKTVLISLISFIIVSGLLFVVGYWFDIKLLGVSIYERTASEIEAGMSVIPFVLALIFSYFCGNYYHQKLR
ncbi:hypothetical protein [Radiobacillus deserti]|uniref:Uncharacterized protein n=1 Tax=Radiobacillus deserti TaxID=2594883 RepID=A0A516KH73_9BACI|nr:hypothetical protein [Radiobacillus deserti]QDP40706.1 hypothetical protein FN924_11225 [Radiobacillus deserti]